MSIARAVLTLNNTIAVLVLGEEVGQLITVIQGQTGPLWQLTFRNADNSLFNLTSVAYTSATLFDRQAMGPGVGAVVAGAFATVSAALGTATFAPATGDTANVGEFTFEILITLSALKYYFRTPVTILERYGP